MKNKTNQLTTESFRFQRTIAVIGILLFIAKLIAWSITNSNTVYSDAMESIVNIIAAFMGLYSLYISAKPKDQDHPYGHGKVEFITSAIEGALIIFAATIIIVEAVQSLMDESKLESLDVGILIIALTGAVNYFLGYLSIKKGKDINSAVLVSSGKHLQSDTITTLGVVVSLALVYFTGIWWIDSVAALIFAAYIMYIGYTIVRGALKGIMDEADFTMLDKLAKLLNDNRKTTWIDVHNTRIQQHGSKLHIDSHITLPYYFELRAAHSEMEDVIKLIMQNTDRHVEFNFHMDDCKEFSCKICQVENCPVRKHSFEEKIEWNSKNISQLQKHSITSDIK